MHVILRLWFSLLAFSCLCWAPTANAEASAQAALGQFNPSADILEQRQALLEILEAVGNPLELLQTTPGLADLGYGGNSSWGMEGTSYCWWWGVTCCGSTLAMELSVCDHFHGVSAVELPALGLTGTLPDVFDRLPDLQALMVAYNRGKQSSSSSSSCASCTTSNSRSRGSKRSSRRTGLAHSASNHTAPQTAYWATFAQAGNNAAVLPACHTSGIHSLVRTTSCAQHAFQHAPTTAAAVITSVTHSPLFNISAP
jgi:hypothetical protein